MKKLLLTAMIASVLIVPFGSVALAETQEAPAAVEAAYISGSVPAESTLAQAISPTVHAIVLAMDSQDISRYTDADADVCWEALYNLLSMYGQLDERSEYSGDTLVIPSETVNDFACALMGRMVSPDEIPAALADRIRYDAEADQYLLVCGSDSLSEIQFNDTEGGEMYGSLVYLVDGTPLNSFRVVADSADNMLGYVITELELA